MSSIIQRPIFNGDNGPITFFLETVSVQNRRIVRGLIKQHGGEVVNEPLKADILIAEGDSRAVSDFIEAWGVDKIILDTSWIHRCLEMGKILDRRHSWGGLMKSHRSSIDGVSDLLEENYQDRQQRLSHLEKAVGEKRPADNSSGVIDPQAYSHKTSSSPNLSLPPPKKRKLEENVETSVVHNASTPSRRTQTPSPPAQIYQTPSSMFTPNYSQSTQNLLAALGQQVLSSPHLIPFVGSALQHIFTEQSNNSPDLIAAQLMDIAQVISISGSSQQPSQMPRSTMSPIRSPTPRTSNISSIKSEDEAEPSLSNSNYHQKGSSTPFSDDGIQRAYRTLPPKKPPTKKDSTPPVTQRTGFFSNLDGASSKFFIDLNIKNRRDLINNVKKNGGVIVSSTSESDYVVLKRSQSQTAVATVPLDKTAVSHEWLEECVRRNKLVPLEPFLIEIPPTPKRRRNQTSSSPQKKAISTEGEIYIGCPLIG
ncbi:hypothetical protein Clacol_008146 [Clathrus columnatus]|uniref:BRCT domain-containing protein n=1 Tax=Clathrus columnatus TaxID=1419009 RepID=A0AAV5AGX2_9AGAM|nr:hypothetical protein Clacol_008146 [Clathrus columnatus]